MLTREQVDVLQDWGVGLEGSGASDELRAAGRAIRLLVEHIDGLERNRWHDRAGISDQIEGAPPSEPPHAEPPHAEPPHAEPPPTMAERSFLGALAERLGSQRP